MLYIFTRDEKGYMSFSQTHNVVSPSYKLVYKAH